MREQARRRGLTVGAGHDDAAVAEVSRVTSRSALRRQARNQVPGDDGARRHARGVDSAPPRRGRPSGRQLSAGALLSRAHCGRPSEPYAAECATAALLAFMVSDGGRHARPRSARQSAPQRSRCCATCCGATAATLGISGALAAIVSGAVRRSWCTSTRAHAASGARTSRQPAPPRRSPSPSIDDQVNISGWFFQPTRCRRPRRPIVLCHGIWTGRRECLPLALRFHARRLQRALLRFSGARPERRTLHQRRPPRDQRRARRGRLPEAAARSRPRAHRRGRLFDGRRGRRSRPRRAARTSPRSSPIAPTPSFLDAARYSFRVVTRVPHVPARADRHALGQVDRQRRRPTLAARSTSSAASRPGRS